MLLKLCRWSGCKNTSEQTYCLEHRRKQADVPRHRQSKRHYQTARWRDRVRPMILARYPLCDTPGCTRPSVDVDHIVPLHKGGTDAMSNLHGLCKLHHGMKTRDEVGVG